MKKILIVLLLLFVGVTALMALFPERTTAFFIDTERSASGLSYEKLDVAGETWTYLEGGPEDAEVILMLHGFGGDKDNWTRFSRSLTDTYRVIAPDLPGFGESVLHRDWDYSLPSQVHRVHDFAAALDLGRFHVVGNSMGGHLAVLYTDAYPEQVTTMALFANGGIRAPAQTDIERAVAAGENPFLVQSESDFDELLEVVFYEAPFVPWPAKGVLARIAIDRAGANQFVFESLFGGEFPQLEPILGGISVPALVLWGKQDRVLDVSAVDIMRLLLPAADVVVMGDMGHLPMIERPADTASHYLAFLANH